MSRQNCCYLTWDTHVLCSLLGHKNRGNMFERCKTCLCSIESNRTYTYVYYAYDTYRCICDLTRTMIWRNAVTWIKRTCRSFIIMLQGEAVGFDTRKWERETRQQWGKQKQAQWLPAYWLNLLSPFPVSNVINIVTHGHTCYVQGGPYGRRKGFLTPNRDAPLTDGAAVQLQ